MAARQNGRPQSFEQDDVFEEHVYEVPFANGAQNGSSRRSANMANNGDVNGEFKENYSHVTRRNMTRNSKHGEGNRKATTATQNGAVGKSNHFVQRTANGSTNSKSERWQQGKSMSLPAKSASRPGVKVPPPSLITRRLCSDTSSEESSSDDLALPPPPAKSERNLRTRSLPLPSKLNLNFQFLNGLNNLCKCGWYWGPLSSKEAEVKLAGKPDGSFLVRDSNDNRYLLSLSFRSEQKTLHTRIEFCKGKFSFYAAPFISAGTFTSVVELIDNCMATSKERVYCYTKGRARNGATFPVRLTKPLSRFEYVCTLQHLCRFVIRQHFTLENIGEMPLPGIMKRYLGKNHFDAEPITPTE